MNKTTPQSIQNKLIPFLASLCLFLAAIEFAIPKPLPFMRLGLANMPIILSLYLLSWKEVLILLVLKVFCQAILAGTLFSYIFVFSIAGSFASVFIMMLVQRSFGRKSVFASKAIMSPIGISLCGALANTGAQILMSRIMLFGASVRYIAPVLLISGIITGVLLGLFTAVFMDCSKWYSNVLKPKVTFTNSNLNQKITKTPVSRYMWTFFLLGVGFPVLLVQKNLLILWTAVLVFAICVYFKKGKLRLFMPFIIFLSVTLLNLYPEYGKILYTFLHFRVTEGALIYGLRRSGVLLGMVFLSQAAIDSSIKLPGRIGIIFAQILTYFEELTTQKKSSLKLKKSFTGIIDSIDSKLLVVYR